MDIIQISEEINKKINEIDKVRSVIKDRGIEKAKAVTEYEKQLAICIIKLKNGEPAEVDDKIIESSKLQANLLEKVAKGMCALYKLEAEKADALYKSAVINMQALEDQLSAYQSLFRYLKEV